MFGDLGCEKSRIGFKSSGVQELKKRRVETEGAEVGGQSSQRRGTQEHSHFEAQGKQEWLCQMIS
jgi:hypothetical protein